MKKLIKVHCYLFMMTFLCCRKPYNPPVVSATNSYLVVEGIINSGGDSTFIKISKTVKLNNKTTSNPVLGAIVTVESNQGNVFPLYNLSGNGIYSSAPLGLSAPQTYRLRIDAGNGNQYLSDFMTVKPTPPIDSIGYTVQNGSVQLYVNTHDPSNNTRYYRWEYQETWKFNSKFISEFVLNTETNKIEPRTPAQQVYSCFGNDTSSNLLLTSTTKLTNDVVYQSPLLQIPLTSEKFEQKYTILVKQYALTAGAYEFYQNLKTNTEQLGSIFDAQPNQLIGNIHNVNHPDEPVIGYLTITNMQSKRIFITTANLPPYLFATYPYDCREDTALYDKKGYNEVQGNLITPPITNVPTSALYSPFEIVGYLYSTAGCADCTIRGTTKQPPFWK